MKFYQTPETRCLQVNAQTIICASGEPSSAPGRAGQLGTMTITTGTW